MSAKSKKGETSAEEGASGNDSNFTMMILYTVIAINQGCMFIYLGTMPFLFKQYGMDPVTFGYAMSCFAFLTLCSSPIVGRIADVFGSRTVLLTSLASSTVAHLTMGLAPGVTMLLVSRFLSLLMDITAAAQMTVTDIVSESERGRAMSKIMVPVSIGMIVGPTLGGTLSKYLGSQGTLMLTWIAPLFCIFLVLACIPAKKKQSAKAPQGKKGGIDWSKAGELFTKGDIPFLMIMRILSTLPGMIFMMNFQLAGITFFKLTPQGNGMIVSTLGIMNMINNGFVLPFLAKKLHEDTLIKWAPVLSVFTYFLLSQTVAVWHLVLVLYPINLSYSIMENQVMTRLTKSVDSKSTSTMLGIGTALFHFSRTVSPTVGGILMQKIGWSAIGQLGLLASILMATLSLIKFR